MKNYIQNVIGGLKTYSKSISKQSTFIDKPWSIVDSDLELQKLIFKKNKELIMSKNGKVTVGRWDYLAEAKALLIDRGEDKILCNEEFIDDAIMILKLDGTKNEFFTLANENLIPDLDAYSYLKNLRYQKLKISTRELSNGKILEIIMYDEDDGLCIGQHVTIDGEKVSDGIYKSDKINAKFAIINSEIVSLIYETTYDTRNGFKIMIEQRFPNCYLKGEKVWVNGVEASNGKYKVKGGLNIIVEDGVIIKKTFF